MGGVFFVDLLFVSAPICLFALFLGNLRSISHGILIDLRCEKRNSAEEEPIIEADGVNVEIVVFWNGDKNKKIIKL